MDGRATVWRVHGLRLEVELCRSVSRGLQQYAEIFLDEARVDPIGDEIRMRQDRMQQPDVRLDAIDAKFRQGARRTWRPRSRIQARSNGTTSLAISESKAAPVR